MRGTGRTTVRAMAAVALAVLVAAGTTACEPRKPAKDRPIIFLHGWSALGNGNDCASTFGGLERSLRSAGFTGPMVTIAFYDSDTNCDVDLADWASISNSTSWKDLSKVFSHYIKDNYTRNNIPVDIVGHSMGGRMIIDLAAHHPERVLAAVLLNAAAGAPFDESILTASLRSPRKVAGHLLAAAVDAQGDPARLPAAELVAYLRVIAGALGRNVRAPRGLSGALHAIIGSGDFSPLLAAMRRHRLPTIVVHGEKDGVVPFVNAHDMAERADATLYRVPGAHHSWMLTEPRQAADMMRQLLDAELGWALRRTAADERIGDDPEAWQDAMLRAGSPLREHTGDDHLGTEPGRHVDLMRLRSSSAPPRPLPPRRLGGRLVRRFARLSRAAG